MPFCSHNAARGRIRRPRGLGVILADQVKKEFFEAMRRVAQVK